jgi:hypothetical protein
VPRKATFAGEERTNTPIFIRSYGEFWSPDVINWDKNFGLLGKRRSQSSGPDIDFYEERGVYVLYRDFVPVYVGKADRQSIGWRLKLHRESQRKGPRWDRFSWFGIRGIKGNGQLRAQSASAHVPKTALIATLEALLIIVIDPRLNARRERFRNATLFYQSDTDKPKDLAERLDLIEQGLEKVFDQLKRKTPLK